ECALADVVVAPRQIGRGAAELIETPGALPVDQRVERAQQHAALVGCRGTQRRPYLAQPLGPALRQPTDVGRPREQIVPVHVRMVRNSLLRLVGVDVDGLAARDQSRDLVQKRGVGENGKAAGDEGDLHVASNTSMTRAISSCVLKAWGLSRSEPSRMLSTTPAARSAL